MTINTFLEISNEKLDDLIDTVNNDYSIWKKDINGEVMYCYIQKIQIPDLVGGNYIVGCRNEDATISFVAEPLIDKPTNQQVEDMFF